MVAIRPDGSARSARRLLSHRACRPDGLRQAHQYAGAVVRLPQSPNIFCLSSRRCWASRDSVAVGRASSRPRPIGSPVSSQKPYSPASMRASDCEIFFSSLRSRSRVRNSSACSSSIVARSAGIGDDRCVLAQVLRRLAGVGQQVVLQSLQRGAEVVDLLVVHVFAVGHRQQFGLASGRGRPWPSRRWPAWDRISALLRAVDLHLASSAASEAAAARSGRRSARSAPASAPGRHTPPAPWRWPCSWRRRSSASAPAPGSRAPAAWALRQRRSGAWGPASWQRRVRPAWQRLAVPSCAAAPRSWQCPCPSHPPSRAPRSWARCSWPGSSRHSWLDPSRAHRAWAPAGLRGRQRLPGCRCGTPPLGRCRGSLRTRAGLRRRRPAVFGWRAGPLRGGSGSFGRCAGPLGG